MSRVINGKRIYSPELTATGADAIRRLAWSMDMHITKALDQLIKAIPAIKDPSKICLACQDKTICKDCIFSHHLTAEEKSALLAAL
jgi:hypothetical protein